MNLDGLVRCRVSVQNVSGLIVFVWHINDSSSFNVRDRGDLKAQNDGNQRKCAFFHRQTVSHGNDSVTCVFLVEFVWI